MLDYPLDTLDAIQRSGLRIKHSCLIKNLQGDRQGRIPEAEIERLKSKVSVVRLVEAAGIVLAQADTMSTSAASNLPIRSTATRIAFSIS